jgi:hypothetical protein
MVLANAAVMQLRSTLSRTLMTLLPIGLLAPGCSSEQLSSKGQAITCSTDPTTGAVVRCEPGAGTGLGSGSATCQDIDDDGDGEPHDEGEDDPSQSASASETEGEDHDRDHDGIPDDRDCDQRPGEDGERDGLPYDVRPQLQATVRPVIDAFAAAGTQPAAILSVELDGGSWRLTELQAGTAFVVTQADCDHVGNRSVGRDRVIVTWRNADQSVRSDHLDIRYCQ